MMEKEVLRIIFQRPPDVELRLGLELKIGETILGTIIGARILEDGQVFVKVQVTSRVQEPAIASSGNTGV